MLHSEHFQSKLWSAKKISDVHTMFLATQRIQTRSSTVTSTIISVTSQQWLQTFYRSSDLLGTTRDREPWKTTLVLIYKLDVILVWKQGPCRLNDKFARGIFVAKETICETLVFAKDGRERTGCCEGSTIYILFIVYIVMQDCCHNPSTYASANIGLRF